MAERDENKQLALRATNAEQQTAKALLTAQERLQFGRQAVDDMYTQVAEKWLAQQAELTQVQKQFLEKALAFYQRLATEESDDPAVRFETAKAQQRVGAIQNKLGQHKEAEAAFRRAMNSSNSWRARSPTSHSTTKRSPRRTRPGTGCFLHGPAPGGRAGTTSGLEIIRPWPPSSPAKLSTRWTSPRATMNLGALLQWNGKIPRGGGGLPPEHRAFGIVADPLPRRPRSEVPTGRCRRYTWPGIIDADKPAEAESPLRSVAELAPTELVADDPENAEYRVSWPQPTTIWACSSTNSVARWRRRPAIDKLCPCKRDSCEISRRCPCIASNSPCHSAIWACCLNATGRSEEAEQVQRQVAGNHGQAGGRLSQTYPTIRVCAGDGLNNLAIVLMDAGSWEEARQLLEQAIVHQKASCLEEQPRQSLLP